MTFWLLKRSQQKLPDDLEERDVKNKPPTHYKNKGADNLHHKRAKKDKYL